MHLFTSNSSTIYNNEHIGPSENFSKRIYKIPVHFQDSQELQAPCFLRFPVQCTTSLANANAIKSDNKLPRVV